MLTCWFRVVALMGRNGVLPAVPVRAFSLIAAAVIGLSAVVQAQPPTLAARREAAAFAPWIARQASQPASRRYDDLSPEEKARLRRKYKQWQSLPPEKKKVLRERLQQFESMPPADRQRYQRRFDQWQRLDPEERRRIHRKLDKWEQLPPEEKRRIRRKFRNGP